jgi:hypothetical protein
MIFDTLINQMKFAGWLSIDPGLARRLCGGPLRRLCGGVAEWRVYPPQAWLTDLTKVKRRLDPPTILIYLCLPAVCLEGLAPFTAKFGFNCA